MEETVNKSIRTGPGRSCTACRRRKIRCDQRRPCGYCSRLKHECVYATPDDDTNKSSANSLSARMTRVESALQRIEANMTMLITTIPSKASDSYVSKDITESSDRRSAVTEPVDGRLVDEAGDTRYVTGGFWTKLNDVEESNNERVNLPGTSAAPSPASNEQGSHDFPFCTTSRLEDIQELHPPQERIMGLWQVFIDSVDPVLKMIHVPTTQRQVLWACHNLDHAPPAFQSLMFSIYYSAVCSLRWSVSQQTLPVHERKISLSRYRTGLEQTLTKANFLTAPNVTTLQAMTIYLTSARQYMDKAYIWTMTGLLIRLAMKLGLQHDPAFLNLAPFMSEMRRRLWWQIVVLDIRTAEDNDAISLLSPQSYNTKLPANVNDADLDVEMTQLPADKHTSTDMFFTTMRFRVSRDAYKLVFPSSLDAENGRHQSSVQEKNNIIDRLSDDLDKQYFRDCDESIPIVYLTKYATKLVLAKMKLTNNCPSRSEIPKIPQEELNVLIHNAVDIVHFAHGFRSDKRYSRWVWLFEKYVEWDAVAFLLQIMSIVPAIDHVSNTWDTTEAFFRYWLSWVPEGERRWCLLQALRKRAAAKQCMSISSGDSSEAADIEQINQQADDVTGGTSSRPQTWHDHNIFDGHGAFTENLNFLQQEGQLEDPELWSTNEFMAWHFDDTTYSIRGITDWDMFLVDENPVTM